jgi:hypothetical protein
VRRDPSLVRQALAEFRELGLVWHAAETRNLLDSLS